MLDHLVYAAPNLDVAVAEMAERLGVRAAAGGKHRDISTHNALLSLGDGAYLEIISLDPAQPPPSRPRPFGLDTLSGPRLATWAVKAADIESRVERARAAGYNPGEIVALSRNLPDGGQLKWRLTLAEKPVGDGLVPFLIEWISKPHPSESAPKGCTLLNLRGKHPQPGLIQTFLQALEVELPLVQGPTPALIAVLQTPRGQIEIR